jgi:hypothetical protein
VVNSLEEAVKNTRGHQLPRRRHFNS